MVVHVKVSHVYHHPVETVFQTHLDKYPTIKERQVLSMNTIESRKELGGVFYLRRIFTCSNIFPFLLRKLPGLNAPLVFLEEECWLDHSKRKYWIESRNLTWKEYGQVWEKSFFVPDAKNPHWTKFDQEGSVDLGNLGRVGGLLEFFLQRFINHGVVKSIKVMEELLQEL